MTTGIFQPSKHTNKVTIMKFTVLDKLQVSEIFKEVAILMVCTVDPKVEKCKFLTVQKHNESKEALTGLVYKFMINR